MPDADVIAVGGGVAGAALAAFLAREGVRVIVLDAARFPRGKPCGEGLMPHGVDVLADLRLDGAVRSASRELLGVRYSLANGATAMGRFSAARPGCADRALGVERRRLDMLLLEEAGRRGAEIVEGFRVRGLLFSGTRVAGATDGSKEVRGAYVAGADGLHSRVRKLLGWESARRWPRRWAVTGHVQLAPARVLPPEVHVFLLPGAEAYVTPLPAGRALVAWLGGRRLMAQYRGDLAGGYGRALSRLATLLPELDHACAEADVRAIGPFAVRARRVTGDGVLLVGDAAGFLDPITGEGMATGLQQARAAARTIVRALATGDGDLTPFGRAHARLTRTGDRLTWLALALCASPPFSSRALRGLQRRAGLFERLLAINGGAAPLTALGARDWLALLGGR